MRVLVDSQGTPVGKFDREKAEEVYDDRDANGEGRILLRTASGRLVLAVVSQWANIPPVYTVDDSAVINFCASCNIDLPDGASQALDNLDVGGRPEIGPAFSLRFQPELLAAVDAAAKKEELSRAEWIRRAVLGTLGAETIWG
jgi:hypothetical protein